MIPVVLSILEGKNFILGTFDTTNFQEWWKSEPFPGNVESIGKPTHVYGQYHVCICKMTDGTYSIYRTKNMGKSWESVYNTSDIIYTINKIDYGWLIASTSSGWLESYLDSGYTWSVISEFAPGCKTVINIGDDILFAHDGNYVWRSVDLARTWKQVLDCHNIVWTEYHGITSYNTKQTGYIPPALTGNGSRVVVGCGPYIVLSDNYGESWTMPYGWVEPAGISALNQTWILPRDNVRILQLVVTDVFGKEPDDVVTIARILMKGTNKVRYAKNGGGGGAGGSLGEWKILFDLNYLGEDIGSIDTYEVLRVGSSENDILSTISSYDSNNSPIVMTSTDGLSWSSIDTENVTIYEGDPNNDILSPVGQQAFVDEYIAKYTWSGVPCHNSGKWIIDLNKTVRGVSFDQDILVSFRKTKGMSFGYRTSVSKSTSIEPDILNKKYNNKTYLIDMLTKDTDHTNYLVSNLIQDNFGNTYDCYIDLASRIPITYSTYIYNNKTLYDYIYCDVLLFDSPEKTYAMGISLIDDHVEQIMNSIERYSPQSPDIRYPDIPYVPYDSRTQHVTP